MKKAVKLFTMADQYGNVTLQNMVIDEYIKLMKNCKTGPNTLHVAAAWDSLPEASTLKHVMLDWYVAKVGVEWFKREIKCLHPQFVQDLAVGFAQAARAGSRGAAPQDKLRCHYHVHDEGAPKCK